VAMPDLHPSIRQFCKAEKVARDANESGGANPAAPACSRSVEIKKQIARAKRFANEEARMGNRPGFELLVIF